MKAEQHDTPFHWVDEPAQPLVTGNTLGHDDFYVANLPHVALTSQPITSPINTDKIIAIPISHKPDDGFSISIRRPTIKNAKAIMSSSPTTSTKMLRTIPARLVLPERSLQLSANDEHDSHAETDEKYGNRECACHGWRNEQGDEQSKQRQDRNHRPAGFEEGKHKLFRLYH